MIGVDCEDYAVDICSDDIASPKNMLAVVLWVGQGVD